MPNAGRRSPADVLRKIKGKFIDNGVYLDELKKLSHDEQRAKVERDIEADIKRREPMKRRPVAPLERAAKDDGAEKEQFAALRPRKSSMTPPARQQGAAVYAAVNVTTVRNSS
jgi:hypothetical protein